MPRPFIDAVLRAPTGGPSLRIRWNPSTGEIIDTPYAPFKKIFVPTLVPTGSGAVDGGWQKQGTSLTGVTNPITYPIDTAGNQSLALSMTGHTIAYFQVLGLSSAATATTNAPLFNLKKGCIYFIKFALPSKVINTSTNLAWVAGGLASLTPNDDSGAGATVSTSLDTSTVNYQWTIRASNTPGNSLLLFETDDNVTDSATSVTNPSTNAAQSLTVGATPDFTWYNLLINCLDYRNPKVMLNGVYQSLPGLATMAALSDANARVQPFFGISTNGATSGQSGGLVIARVIAAQATTA